MCRASKDAKKAGKGRRRSQQTSRNRKRLLTNFEKGGAKFLTDPGSVLGNVVVSRCSAWFFSRIYLPLLKKIMSEIIPPMLSLELSFEEFVALKAFVSWQGGWRTRCTSSICGPCLSSAHLQPSRTSPFMVAMRCDAKSTPSLGRCICTIKGCVLSESKRAGT